MLKKLINWFINNFVCRHKGHDFEIYSHMPKGGYYPYDMEQAGYCKRCGFDTHK